MRRAWLIVSMACLGPQSAAADTRIDDTVQGDCAPEPRALLVSGSRMRVDHAAGGQDASSLFDGMEETMVHLDHAHRSFHETEVDADATDYTSDVAASSMHRIDREMEKAQAQIEESCKQMRQQGMDCPQIDLSAMMQMAQGMQQGAGTDGSHPRAVDSGRDETIAGATCRWFEDKSGPRLLRERCVASPEALPLVERDRAGFVRAYRTLHKYAAAFEPITQRFAAAQDEAGKGLVLAQRCYDGRGEASGSATVQFSRAELDEALFETPAGYQPMQLGGDGR